MNCQFRVKLFALCLLALLPFIHTRTISFTNRCSQTVWVGSLGSEIPLQGGWTLEPSQSNSIQLPDDRDWSGRFWGRTGCKFDASGQGFCETGDCGGKLQCNGAGGVPPASLAEFTLNNSGGLDFYDVSLVDGYNLPISIESDQPKSSDPYHCGTPSCVSDLNQNCPQELQDTIGGRVVACLSACEKFNTDRYCCRGLYSTRATCPPSNYSVIFKTACPGAYSYAYDDPTSTFTCSKSNYAITFCPNAQLIEY